jgi:hypothetical protein
VRETFHHPDRGVAASQAPQLLQLTLGAFEFALPPTHLHEQQFPRGGCANASRQTFKHWDTEFGLEIEKRRFTADGEVLSRAAARRIEPQYATSAK